MGRINIEQTVRFFKINNLVADFSDIVFDYKTKRVCINGILLLMNGQAMEFISGRLDSRDGYKIAKELMEMPWPYMTGLVSGWLGHDKDDHQDDVRNMWKVYLSRPDDKRKYKNFEDFYAFYNNEDSEMGRRDGLAVRKGVLNE
jgi:hypothetical protein